MSKVTPLSASRAAFAADYRYLGPAVVTALCDDGVMVRAGSGPVVHARMAMALPYEASLGDELLVIGDLEGHYVIGVLSGAGRVSLSMAGDVDVHARGGELRLRGDTGVALDAPVVRLQADKLRVVADSAVHKLRSLVQRVRGLATSHLGRSETVVDEELRTTAQSATLLTEETVKINGQQIHLG